MMKQSANGQRETSGRELERLAVELLRDALGSAVSVTYPAEDAEIDMILRLRDGRSLGVEFKSLDARHDPAPGAADHPVYVLRRATRAVQDELRREGVSFVDLSGTVYLALPSILVDRTHLRPPRGLGAIHQPLDPFSDRGSLVVRALMEAEDRDERAWGVRELAVEAGVSAATATRVVREIERIGAARVKRGGRTAEVRLTDAAALFAAWTRAYDWMRNRSVTFSAPVGDAERFASRLAREWTGPRWALTLHAGAARVAPHASWDRVHAYVDARDTPVLLSAGEAHGWKPARDGRLVLMRPYYKTSVWRGVREIHGAPVVSDLQLALDLWHYPLRGREQAEHLLSDTRLVG